MTNPIKVEYEKILIPYIEKRQKESFKVINKTIQNCECDICGYRWKPKTEKSPRLCVKCKSPNWNVLDDLKKKYGYSYEKITSKEISKLKEKHGWKVWKEIKISRNPYSQIKILKEVYEINKKDLQDKKEEIKELNLYIIEGEKQIKKLEEEIKAIERYEKDGEKFVKLKNFKNEK